MFLSWVFFCRMSVRCLVSFLFLSVCLISHFICVQLCVTLWSAACYSPLSMGFSRQETIHTGLSGFSTGLNSYWIEYWSGLPCCPPGDLSNPGITLGSLSSPAIAGGFFTTSTTWEAPPSWVLVKYCPIQVLEPSLPDTSWLTGTLIVHVAAFVNSFSLGVDLPFWCLCFCHSVSIFLILESIWESLIIQHLLLY